MMKKFQVIYYIFLASCNSFIKSFLIATETGQFKKWRQQKQNYTSELYALKSFTQKVTISEMKRQAMEWERLSADPYIYICVCICVYMCVYVCVCVYIYIYIYIYI